MTNFYKCAGLLLTEQYENALIMAPSYMWQYHLFGEEIFGVTGHSCAAQIVAK